MRRKQKKPPTLNAQFGLPKGTSLFKRRRADAQSLDKYPEHSPYPVYHYEPMILGTREMSARFRAIRQAM